MVVFGGKVLGMELTLKRLAIKRDMLRHLT